MNILITSVSRKVSLVKAFQQALAQEGSGRVIAVDISPLAPALYCADEHYLVPADNKPEFLEMMLHLCEQNKIKLLIPTRDEELPFFAEHKKEFAYAGTVVMVAVPDVIKRCQDKELFLEFCHKNGFTTPETYKNIDLAGSIGFPLFIKPRYGKGGKQAIRVDSKTELEIMLKDMPDAIIQEFVQALEYTIDLFADFSGRVISVVPRERLYIFGGESFISKTVNNPVLIQEAIRLSTALGLVGHNTIQCFFENNTVEFVEVNPRFGGAACLGFAAGAPTPLFLVKLLKGETVEPVIGSFRNNYIMLRYTEDLFLDEKSLTKRHFQ
jgi:carbamoyl-phosphate synthase large subunit